MTGKAASKAVSRIAGSIGLLLAVVTMAVADRRHWRRGAGSVASALGGHAADRRGIGLLQRWLRGGNGVFAAVALAFGLGL